MIVWILGENNLLCQIISETLVGVGIKVIFVCILVEIFFHCSNQINCGFSFFFSTL